ncbi:MAG TPA: HYR domain-containing protein [Saprospiraceae bacterium]|nr:HYR domain-containing protein [Saprospiraceae bacterium]
MRNILLILTLFASLVFAREAVAQTVTLKADTVSISCTSSDTFLIPIRVKGFQNIGSFQFTLMWDTAKLDYAYTTPINPLLLGAGVDFDSNTTQIGVGKIAFLWTKTTGASLPDDSIVFNIAFRRIGGSFASLMFVNTPVPVEVANANADVLPVVTVTGGAKPIDDKAPQIFCPANVTVQGVGPTPANGIAPDSIADNCAPVANVGWASTGATMTSQPNDPDASGFPFNIGLSTVIYTATDAGGNTATCSFTVTTELSFSSDTLTIIAQNATASCSQTVSINITAINFDSIGSLQFSLGWDAGVLQFGSVSNFNPALQLILGDNFNTTQTPNGLLAFLWTANAPEGVTLPPGATLFTINLNVQTGGGTSSPLTFGDVPVVREAYSNATGTPEEIGAYWINGSVNIVDNVPPILECPDNVSVDLPIGNTNVQVNGLQPLALLDNCTGNINLAYLRTGATSGSGTGNANGSYNPGVTTVTYTATDAAGNTSTCAFTVTVNAAGLLTLLIDSVEVDCQTSGGQVAVDIFVENWDDIFGLQFQVEWDETVLQFDTFNNFNPGLNLTPADFGVTQTGSGILSFFAGGPSSNWPQLPDSSVVFTIIFNVLNAGGTSSISYTGFIEAINSAINTVPVATVGGYFSAGSDTSAPLVTCPQDITMTIIGNECNTNVFIPLPTASDACSGIDSITRVPSGNVFASGITPVTYTVKDSAGNTATCTFSVTINDNTPPVLTNCPTGISGIAPGFTCQGQVNWPPPVASDPCGQTNLTVTSNYTPDSIFPVGQTLVFYTVTDVSGNTANCSFLVTIQDTAAPIITCPGNLTVPPDGSPNCGAVVDFNLPDAFDNCDTSVAIVVIAGDPEPLDTFPAGTTTLTYFAVDGSDNESSCSFTITVVDNVGPLLSCPGDTVFTAAQDTCGAFAAWPAVTANDACDGIVTPTSPFQSGQFFPVGTTAVPYSATDASGNTSACSFTVTVTESVPPIILGCPTDRVVLLSPGNCDTVIFWDPPLATDNCLLDTMTTTHFPGSVFQAGTTVVTYTAVDAAGNTTICTFDINAVDEIKPVLSACPDDITVTSNDACGVEVNWTSPTATDNCTPDSAIVYSYSHTPPDTFFSGVTTVVVLAYDANGNFDSCHFKITVNTSNPPGWTNVPQNIVITGCPQTATWTPPTPVGFCVIDTLYSSHQPGDFFGTDTTVVTYTWVDSLSGLPTSVSFFVIIGETEPPAISCPTSPIVVNVGGGIISDPSEFLEFADTTANCTGAQLEFGIPSATDNCGIASLLQTDGLASGAAFPVGLDTLAFTAVDSSGNSAVCLVAIEVQALPALVVTSSPAFGCRNEPVTVTATAIPGATYTWTFGDQTLGDTDNTVTISEFGSANVGTYTAMANVNGCILQSSSVTVAFATAPDAVDDTDIFIAPGDTIEFDILENDILVPPSDFDITSVGALNGLENLGNGLFRYTGTTGGEFLYTVCSKSCPDLCDQALVVILLQDDRECRVPNIFTPNGDFINDWLVIPCLDSGLYPDNSLVVYNQWGDKVYEASPYFNDPQSGNDHVPWQGTLDGKPGQDLPDATYFYIFKPGSGEPAIKGFVEIFR